MGDPMLQAGTGAIDEDDYFPDGALGPIAQTPARGPSFQPGSNPAAPVQAKGDLDGPDVHAAADHGTRGAGGTLPHLDVIQRAFGHHDVSGVRAHVGGPAAEASQAIGARAYASGDAVAFADAPDLHTAAHEAAHVVQQRGGVRLAGGVGQAGDEHEQHADAVADAVVRGDSAQPLLDQRAHRGAAGGPAVQRFPGDTLILDALAQQLLGGDEDEDEDEAASDEEAEDAPTSEPEVHVPRPSAAAAGYLPKSSNQAPSSGGEAGSTAEPPRVEVEHEDGEVDIHGEGSGPDASAGFELTPDGIVEAAKAFVGGRFLTHDGGDVALGLFGASNGEDTKAGVEAKGRFGQGSQAQREEQRKRRGERRGKRRVKRDSRRKRRKASR